MQLSEWNWGRTKNAECSIFLRNICQAAIVHQQDEKINVLNWYILLSICLASLTLHSNHLSKTEFSHSHKVKGKVSFGEPSHTFCQMINSEILAMLICCQNFYFLKWNIKQMRQKIIYRGSLWCKFEQHHCILHRCIKLSQLLSSEVAVQGDIWVEGPPLHQNHKWNIKWSARLGGRAPATPKS